jgi:hypothetical protein
MKDIKNGNRLRIAAIVLLWMMGGCWLRFICGSYLGPDCSHTVLKLKIEN